MSTHGDDAHTGAASHMRAYWGVFLALLALTGVTVWVALHDFGMLNTPIALGIASLKATLVILYFMHVRWSSRLVWLFAAAGFFFLVIMLGFTFSDYVTRGWSSRQPAESATNER